MYHLRLYHHQDLPACHRQSKLKSLVKSNQHSAGHTMAPADIKNPEEVIIEENIKNPMLVHAATNWPPMNQATSPSFKSYQEFCHRLAHLLNLKFVTQNCQESAAANFDVRSVWLLAENPQVYTQNQSKIFLLLIKKSLVSPESITSSKSILLGSNFGYFVAQKIPSNIFKNGNG